ncbi:DUF4436 domain-containing protein [Mycobacterium sp.]|uniref:DUF4436 domain-containing protein n=1 Tax=Mycobacterium sp. TaxID=1785 RepID=UPI0025DAAFEE|nr:DUF4436 domain-containing protein [Mycobacterium sp.]MBW0011574.1 DUF4436 domain-containing protein [Mycobacterium sp.]
MTAEPSPPESRGPRIAIAFGIVLAVIALYVLSLVAVHLLAKSAPELPAVDFSKLEAEDSVVQVHLEKLDTVANRLTVNVLVYPKDSLYDKNFGVLTTDAAVRLYPENDLGDLQYPVGKAPAQVSTALVAHGDPGNWPFDSYHTDDIAADVFTGSGQSREKVPARVEVTGKLDGWDARVTRVHDPADPPDVQDNVRLTLSRSKGPLIFDLGICLVLITLPALALWVAIPMALGRTSFLPPFGTWYAAMLFAVMPLRNFLPGNPPPGSWIDQAVVIWVLIGLVVAMTIFIYAWWRSRDRKKPSKT